MLIDSIFFSAEIYRCFWMRKDRKIGSTFKRMFSFSEMLNRKRVQIFVFLTAYMRNSRKWCGMKARESVREREWENETEIGKENRRKSKEKTKWHNFAYTFGHAVTHKGNMKEIWIHFVGKIERGDSRSSSKFSLAETMNRFVLFDIVWPVRRRVACSVITIILLFSLRKKYEFCKIWFMMQSIFCLRKKYALSQCAASLSRCNYLKRFYKTVLLTHRHCPIALPFLLWLYSFFARWKLLLAFWQTDGEHWALNIELSVNTERCMCVRVCNILLHEMNSEWTANRNEMDDRIGSLMQTKNKRSPFSVRGITPEKIARILRCIPSHYSHLYNHKIWLKSH